MINRLKLSVSVAAVALLMSAVAASSLKAADIVDEGCTLSGSVMAGYMFNSQDFDFDSSDDEDDLGNKDADWDTPFGEGAGLVTCGGFNVQADVAYYAHSADVDVEDIDLDQTNTHIGGDVFWRDPSFATLGIQASWISQDIISKDVDTFRVGLFGEFYLNDSFTLGGSAAYFNTDDVDTFEGKDADGFELAAWGRFYIIPDLALTLRGDLLLADTSIESEDADLDGWAITGDAEYLVWDQGLSLFAGARYAERELDFDDVDLDITVNDFQVFGGLKFYFGHDGTLIERQRTGTVDNTSLWNEKLPAFIPSLFATEDEGAT
jgi:hypothetical protein